jgi:hypothetical protein
MTVSRWTMPNWSVGTPLRGAEAFHDPSCSAAKQMKAAFGFFFGSGMINVSTTHPPMLMRLRGGAMTATKGGIAGDALTEALVGFAARGGGRGDDALCISEHHSVIRPMSSDTDDDGWEASNVAHDRLVVDPPVQVEIATWTHAGQLDYWVKTGSGNGGSGSDGFRVRTASSGGSGLVIYVLWAAQRHNCWG